MKKFKKLMVGIFTLILGLFITSNVMAASDTIIIHGGDLHPTGEKMYVGDNYIDAIHSLNQSNINFYARVSRDAWGFDPHVYERTIADQQEVNTYNLYVSNDDDYYPEAEWAGENGAAYIYGSVTMISE